MAQTSGLWVVCLAPLLVIGCSEKGQLQGAKAEVAETSVKVVLPPVPEFTPPTPPGDGTHSVAEMRLLGGKFLDTDVKLTGVVVWIYDCPTALRAEKPDITDAELKKILTDEPERCMRPHFYLGDTAETPPEKAVWVADIPRAPREDEKKTLPDEELKTMTDAFKAVPVYKVGDRVAVSGRWVQTSPRGMVNSDGLLAFGSLENLTAPAAPAPTK